MVINMNRYEIDDIYIVAEIGQNHNGDLKIAKELIDDAYLAGCSAVKTAKRDLKYELSDRAYKRIYDSPNAFARTYGKHREFLELSFEDHKFLKRYTNNRKMDYFLSVCDIPSLEFAMELKCPIIKIPSKEINNIPLLEAIAKTSKPIAYSIGLATRAEIKKAMEIFKHKGRKAIMVITTSMYPTYLDNINLNRLKTYSYIRKGFSSHNPNPMLGVAAVVLGAKYIEYHITLDREMKGSDHICSLEVDEFGYLVQSINDIQIALGSTEIPEILPSYLNSTKKKLWKTKQEDGVYRIL